MAFGLASTPWIALSLILLFHGQWGLAILLVTRVLLVGGCRYFVAVAALKTYAN